MRLEQCFPYILSQGTYSTLFSNNPMAHHQTPTISQKVYAMSYNDFLISSYSLSVKPGPVSLNATLIYSKELKKEKLYFSVFLT